MFISQSHGATECNMAQKQIILRVPIIWRGKKFMLEINSEATLLELGEELQKLTDVKADTMKLIVPKSSQNTSGLLEPFSVDHSSIKLQDTRIVEEKPLRMMGVLEEEVDQMLKDGKAKLRIVGFEEEEKRMKDRISRGTRQMVKLPQGPCIFCEFRTLELPGIKLNPPPSEALKRLHMLAADPGIVAIMNKHRWRVGILTEMEPVGYVGVSPKCLLGLNKNHGEEISLRLRTDDLKGFRKYQIIKKTLLHELAHMVFSEHDENFHALDKQLNQEAFSLDWTQSKSHTLADTRFSKDDLDMDFETESNLPQKLGGESSAMAASARAASVAAASHRLADYSTSSVGPFSNHDINDDIANDLGNLNFVRVTKKEELKIVHDDCSNQVKLKFDPDYSEVRETMVLEAVSEASESKANPCYLICDDTEMRTVSGVNVEEEPDPDDSEVDGMAVDRVSIDILPIHVENNLKHVVGTTEEPDPDESDSLNNAGKNITSGDGDHSQVRKNDKNNDHAEGKNFVPVHGFTLDEPGPDDEELKRIQDPVNTFCDKLKKAIELLHNELSPSEAAVILQTLFKIIRNVSENPDDMKYKRLRQTNPVFERSIAKHKAAVEVLFLVGFSEEVITDENGKSETYLVLKRNDPGLLWLAKSSLETAFDE